MQANKYLAKRSHDLAARLSIYASGSGSLSFVWVSETLENKGNAIAEKVTERDVRNFILSDKEYYSSYDVIELNGQIQLAPIITEISPSHITIKGTSFEVRDGHLWRDYGDEKLLVKHISTLAAYRFWKEYRNDWKVL